MEEFCAAPTGLTGASGAPGGGALPLTLVFPVWSPSSLFLHVLSSSWSIGLGNDVGWS